MPKEIKELKTFDKGENSWADARDIPEGYSHKLEGLLPADIGQLKALPAFAMSPNYRKALDEAQSGSDITGHVEPPAFTNGDFGTADEGGRWKTQVGRVSRMRGTSTAEGTETNKVHVVVCMIKEESGTITADGAVKYSSSGQKSDAVYELIASASSFTSRHVGNFVYNKATKKATYITGIKNSTTLYVSDDIFNTIGDDFKIPGFGKYNMLKGETGTTHMKPPLYDARIQDMYGSRHYGIRIMENDDAANLTKFKVSKGITGMSHGNNGFHTPKDIYEGYYEGYSRNWKPTPTDVSATTYNNGDYSAGYDGHLQNKFDSDLNGVRICRDKPLSEAFVMSNYVNSGSGNYDRFESDIYKIDEGVYIRFVNMSTSGLDKKVVVGDTWWFEINSPVNFNSSKVPNGGGYIGAGSMDRSLDGINSRTDILCAYYDGHVYAHDNLEYDKYLYANDSLLDYRWTNKPRWQ